MYFQNAYPVFLSLKDCDCLVVGFGKVGQRKLAGLLPCRPRHALALDIRPRDCFSPEAQALLRQENVKFEQRKWKDADLAKNSLVFACTSDEKENNLIASACLANKILCNNASNPSMGNFTVPAQARKKGMVAALSTSGSSPLLAGIWRAELETWLDSKARLAWLLGRLRPEILSLHQKQDMNKKIFLQIVSSPIPSWLEEDKTDCCREWLQKNIPQISSSALDRIFTDYALNFA